MVHGRVSTRELCLRPSHTQEQMDSVVGIVLQCKIERFTRQRATNPKTKIFFNLTNADRPQLWLPTNWRFSWLNKYPETKVRYFSLVRGFTDSVVC